MAEVAIAQLLDKLHRYLTEFQTTGTQELWSYPGFHDAYLLNSPVPWTDKISAMRSIQFVKTFLSYNDANWNSVDDEHKHFAYLRDQSKTYFQLLSLQIQDVFRSENPRNLASQLSCCFITIAFLRDGVGRIYNELVKLPKAALFVNGVVFDKMAESVQHYLISAPKKPVGWGRTRRDYREVEGNYVATVQKLKRYRYLVCRFSKQCTDQKKLQSVLARAGAVVITILHMAYTNDVTETDTAEMEEIILRSSFDMSRKLSPQDQDAGDVYLEVLSANVEIVKALKPMDSEDVVESLVSLLQLAQNQVHILGEILDSPTLELIIEEPGDHNEQVEALLKQGYAAVAREAGSLCLSTLNHAALSNLLHKLNIIKGELFVLELHNHKACLTSYRENRTTTIKEAFRFLSHFLKTTEMHMEDIDKLIVSLIQAYLVEAGSLGKSRQTALLSEAMIIESSVAIFKLFKAEALFLLLSHNTSSLKVLAEFRIETLHKSLVFLTKLLSGPPSDNLKEERVSTVCRNLASKAACCVSFFDESHRVLNQPVHMIQSPSPWSLFNNFPKNDGVVFAEHLLGKLRKLVTDMLDTVSLMHHQVDALLGELEFLVSFLKDVNRDDRKNKDLGLQVTWLIYDSEYVIDMFILGDVPLCYHQLVYFIVIEEAKLIRLQILNHCCEEESFEVPLQDVQLTLADETRGDSNQITDEVIVGFDDQAKIIVEQLQHGSEHLQVVSLVGMAGIGKTTLADKVCRTNSILHHFAIRARCSVSQVYRKRELLLEILGDCTDVDGEMEQKDDDDLALKVKQKLRGKRYLIVVDDIWSIEHWDDLKLSFPDDITGSRILLTTRDRDVARKANPEKEPYVLHLLSPLQSWDLLQGKLFQGGECPPHLLKAGRLVAACCRGLPLAIVVIAGILVRKEMTKEEWEEIAENLNSQIADDQETQFMDTLEFSYNHLPCYLKPCYLYLGSFLEDQEISVKKLLWLWIGEGFIPDMDYKRLEETAEDYFEELMNRSLVMEARKSSSGGTKTFRIHDMLRDLCLRKAKEENFMQLISMNDSNNSKSLIGMQYRLCVHSLKENFIQLKPTASHVHSLLFFATNNTQDNNLYDISSIVQDFKLLRVLDLEPITASVFPSGIDMLLCLHYLPIKGNVKSVPSSIAKLWNLQTLIVKGTWGDIALPSSLWSMDTLRHVHIHPRASLTLQSPELENVIEMKNLTTFSCPAFSDAKLSEEILKRWTRLKKMKCIFLKHWDNSGKCSTYPAMELLTNLESLNLYCGGSSLESELSFPVSLKKLTLSRFCLPWDYMSVISQLSSLEVLKLLFKAFEGDTWAMKEETFPKLKVLMFENLNLATWNNSLDCSYHFPELQRLVLWNCKKFDEVPSSFGEVSTLETVEVQWCSRSAANSVKTIWEQQLDFGNQDFQMMISPPEWDFRRSS